MKYSQKYTLVHFIHPISVGVEFEVSNWPIHTTLADVFAIDRKSSNIDEKLNRVLADSGIAETQANNETILGSTRVIILEKTESLVRLHQKIVELLEKNNAVFNNPEFTHDGFLPHSTIQANEHLNPGDKVSVSSISLIDMFPDGDWQKRKVLANFTIGGKH